MARHIVILECRQASRPRPRLFSWAFTQQALGKAGEFRARPVGFPDNSPVGEQPDDDATIRAAQRSNTVAWLKTGRFAERLQDLRHRLPV